MNLTRADLAVLGQRTVAKARHHEPTMAPTKGLTPTITGPGRRTYLHFEAKGVAIATWNDARERAQVEWLSYEDWRRRCSTVVASL
jgi:hypothetical protein